MAFVFERAAPAAAGEPVMRYLPAILATLFRPAPLPSAPPMQTREPRDSITQAIAVAVSEHERVAADIQTDYSQQLRSTIDELLERIGQKHDDPNG